MSAKSQQVVLIPQERVPVLIGDSGKAKKAMEQASNCSLNIDSETGEVTIIGTDALAVWQCAEVIRAVARGFSPEIAQKLFIEGYEYEQINVQDYAGKSKKKLIRLRGRVIGESGKAKRRLQALTDTVIVIYGKTVGVIGKTIGVGAAKRSIEMLLSGSPHLRAFETAEGMMKNE